MIGQIKSLSWLILKELNVVFTSTLLNTFRELGPMVLFIISLLMVSVIT